MTDIEQRKAAALEWLNFSTEMLKQPYDGRTPELKELDDKIIKIQDTLRLLCQPSPTAARLRRRVQKYCQAVIILMRHVPQ